MENLLQIKILATKIHQLTTVWSFKKTDSLVYQILREYQYLFYLFYFLFLLGAVKM